MILPGQTQAIAELGDIFYTFLPGSGAKYTWKEVAEANGVGMHWIGGSKRPAIVNLLEKTFEYHKGQFCGLVLTAVCGGIKYRMKNGNPIKREEIDQLNAIVARLNFKVPELHDAAFLNGLPLGNTPVNSSPQTVTTQPAPATGLKHADLEELKKRFDAIIKEKNVQKRGYDFEKFLYDFFKRHGLEPDGPFKVKGEQIDGSFDWHGDVFLVEARWRADAANAADLFVFRGKCEKAEWTRGLFISINGFTDLSAESFQSGRRTNIITMTGYDLYLILEGRWSLIEAIKVKAKHAGKTNSIIADLAQISDSE